MNPIQIGCGLGASKSKVVAKRDIPSGNIIISHFERAAKEGRKRFAMSTEGGGCKGRYLRRER